MKTKLTLSIDEKVVVKAKKAARKENKSLSELIEGFLKKRFTPTKSETPISDSLRGILKGKIPSHSTYKELRDQMYKEKYGL